jgi:hypothetical protein
MKTRTLLLLALVCGVTILLAGGVMLFQLTGADELADPTSVGDPVQVGDMTVTVDDAEESVGVLTIVLRIGGVDDANGSEGFRLIASGRPVLPTQDGENCSATTVAEQFCSLDFDVSSADGSSRVLFYERGEEQARWVLDLP